MIVSHRHRLIFLKTRKTAGTSVEIALSRHCGPEDVLTPISPDDEATRRREGGAGPQHHRLPLRMYTRHDWARLVRKGRRAEAYNHMPAAMVRDLVGPDTWREYTKLTIVRNPWDTVVSFYFWKTRRGERPPLGDFLATYPLTNLRGNEAIYRIGDEVVADRVVRYESLAEDLEKVRLELGLPEPLRLPSAKGGARPDRRPYRDYYTPADAALVAELFARPIEEFGYTF